jgi:hypothetical protein
MFDKSGKPLSQPQTQKPVVLRTRGNRPLTWLLDLPLSVRVGSLLTLLVLVLLLVGCATPSTMPTESARNPQPPQLSEPLPSESYLQQAQKLIESWRNAVTGM